MQLLLFLLSLVCAVTTTFQSFDIKAEPPKELEIYNSSTKRMFAVLIENVPDGKVWLIHNSERKEIGEVATPGKFASRASDDFWQSHYLSSQNKSKGCVSLASTNGISVRCGPNRQYDPTKPDNWMASEFKIVPFTTEVIDSTIAVSSPGGYDLFNDWSPYAGNPVYAFDKGSWRPIDQYFADPTRQLPEKILIDVLRPTKRIKYIEFENWAVGDVVNGIKMSEPGKVVVMEENDTSQQIAKVLERVATSLPIAGTEYSRLGQISNTDGGILELSTVKWTGKNSDEFRGGVQITSINHAKYMKQNLGIEDYIGKGKRMIIGPTSSYNEDLKTSYVNETGLTNEPLEGLPPIFSGYLRCYFDPGNFEDSFRYYVSQDFGKSWRLTNEIPGNSNGSGENEVKYWTHIRLMVGR
jgi:hypothetical protein